MFEIQHSAAVHIPLALAVIFPAAYVLFLYLIKTEFLPYRAWYLLLSLAGVNLANTAFAYVTGHEHLALSPAPSELLMRHQDLALSFSGTWLGIIILIPLAFVWRGKPLSKIAHLLLLILLAAQVVLAVKLGHVGGELVFGN